MIMANKYRENIFLFTITSIITTTTVVLVILLVFILTGLLPAVGKQTMNGIIVCSLASVCTLAIYVVVLKRHPVSKAIDTSMQTFIPVVNDAQAAEVYEAIRQQHELEKANIDKAILAAIKLYIDLTLSPYMKDTSLSLLYNNVYLWHHDKEAVLTPVDADGHLSTLDLRHIAWNIGERCGWKGEDRARFIKQSFPIEMKDLEIETIRRNLRQKGTARILLDVPEKDSFEFHYPDKAILLPHTA